MTEDVARVQTVNCDFGLYKIKQNELNDKEQVFSSGLLEARPVYDTNKGTLITDLYSYLKFLCQQSFIYRKTFTATCPA